MNWNCSPFAFKKMEISTRARNLLILLAILLLAAFLRFYGIEWGLPQVYEEATPLTHAWKMWGWGANKSFDLNPHFFNYPSLTIYIQLVAQGFLYLVLLLFGGIDSTLDYQILYVVDKTPFFLLGRSITALFGVATVWITYIMGRKVMGKTLAIPAAFLLAVNTFHISKSQVVEVDVPVTFFVILALWVFVGLIETPIKKNYLLAGLTVGLAASTKYTAVLLLFPLLVAHVFTQRNALNSRKLKRVSGKQAPLWFLPILALATAVFVFFVTSPFVVLDSSTFFEHFFLERQHMQEGHFGLETVPTWLFYSQSLTNTILGWPLTILTLFGLIYLAGVRRQKWAIVLAAFLVPYLIVVISWSMKANRYLLPILPAVLLLAGGMFSELLNNRIFARAPRVWRLGIAVFVILLLGAPIHATDSDFLNRLRLDTRTEAKQWVETNIPSESFIVAEHYGPDLLGANLLCTLEPDVRNKILDKRTETPIYAVQRLPLLQVKPERSGVFYNLSLYGDADAVIISDRVKSRYLKEPNRFRPQVTFYDSLETRFEKIHEFLPEGKTGPAITIYRNPRNKEPFGRRGTVRGPRAVDPSPRRVARAEEFFYENLGFNYETFGYFEEALACYELAFHYPIIQPVKYESLVLGKTRCFLVLGKPDEAVKALRKGEDYAPNQAIREHLRRMRQMILSRSQTVK